MCKYEQLASAAAINAKKKHKIDGKIYESKAVYFGFYDEFWTKSSTKPTSTAAIFDGSINPPDQDSSLNILKIFEDKYLVRDSPVLTLIVGKNTNTQRITFQWF